MIVRFWACIVRVLCVYCACIAGFRVVYLSGHTVCTAPFPQLHARKHMLTASVSVADHRKKQHKYTHKTRKHCAILCILR